MKINKMKIQEHIVPESGADAAKRRLRKVAASNDGFGLCIYREKKNIQEQVRIKNTQKMMKKSYPKSFQEMSKIR